MVTTDKLINILKNITRLAQQTEQGIVSNIEVQKTHPTRLKRAENYLQLAYDEVKLVREEEEVGLAHWEEVSDAFPIIIGRLNDQMTIQQNLDFIAATDKKHLTEFLGHILEVGQPVFQEVLEKLAAEDFATVEDIMDIARRKRV